MLKTYREQIDILDKKLLELFNERFTITDKVWIYKKENNLPIVQKDRYNTLLEEKIRLWKKYGLNEEFIKDIFDIIHDYSVKRQEQLKEKRDLDEI